MAERGSFWDKAQVLIAVAGGLIGAAYIVSPDLRRDVEIHITNRAAWYYAGKYVVHAAPEFAPGGWEGVADGCAGKAPERSFYHVAWDEDRPFDDAVFETMKGQILLSLGDGPPTPGRDATRDAERFSQTPIVSIARPDQCYYVRDAVWRDIGPVAGCDGVERETRFHWVEAVRVTCD